MRRKILHRNKFLTILFTVALALAGCNRKTVFHHYEHVSPEGWNRTDTLHFQVAPANNNIMLHEELELRATSHYPFTNLSLVVEQTIHPSHTGISYYSSHSIKRVDTLKCSLTDKNGIATGKGINYFYHHFHLADISINKGDSVIISVHHNMRKEVLSGIADVGILISSR